MKVDIVVESALSTSTRARQVAAMFDCPADEKARLEWHLELPIEGQPWNVGYIVGPSGSGKTTVMREAFGEPKPLAWNGASVVDDFASHLAMEDIVAACSAVGFNTIPAWMRPYAVLSNGEKFRVELARRLLETSDDPGVPTVIDEFTSVVDRQVAQIGSHAVQEFVRKSDRKFVAVGCHYDCLEWLAPDWVLDMATRSFTRRSLQRRPAIECTVGRVPRAAWDLFAPFHYMSADLSRTARCFALWAGDRIAAFAGLLHFPHPKVRDIMRVSRLVTLPDWQGFGLAMALVDQLGAAHAGIDKRLRTYPAHPALVRTFQKSPNWRQTKEAGEFSPNRGDTSTMSTTGATGGFGGRPCGVFEYVGPAMAQRQAERLIAA